MGKLISVVILASLLMGIPVSAHLPETSDPDNYAPTLGWISDISGEVYVISADGVTQAVGEGSPIVGSCVIETGADGRIVVQLEDYTDHESSLTVESNSKVEIELSSGKHFDDTISHQWSIVPHGVSIIMDQGQLQFAIVSNEERYSISIDTPNAELTLPQSLYQYGEIVFSVYVEREEEADGLGEDIGSMMGDFLGQLAQMGGQQMDEETASDMAKVMEQYGQNLGEGEQSGFDVAEHGIKTHLNVKSGEVWLGDTSVKSGESYVVDGINPPARTRGSAVSELPQAVAHESLNTKPAVLLNVPLNAQAERPDLAVNMKTQLEMIASDSSGMPADMMQTAVWVYETTKDSDQVLQGNPWPANTKRTTEQKEISGAIYDLVDNFGESLNEVWGSDWSFRAEMAAMQYAGQSFTTSTYSYTVPPVKSVTVNVISPWLDPKSLEVYEGTYIMIMETSVKLPF